MIELKNGRCVMAGTMSDLIKECTSILAGLYVELKKGVGEEKAMEALTCMGRIAVDPETAEKGIQDVFSVSIPMKK